VAKKRRQKTEKKEESDFKLPVFDEHEFISLELRKSKMSFVAFLYAILMVIITFALYTVTYPDWRPSVVIGLLAVAGIPFLANLIKMDISDFDWKNWVGAGAVYILSWLAIFILVCNPPFSDFAAPDIDDDETKVSYQKLNNETWVSWNTDNTPPTLSSPNRIRIQTKITDNAEVDKDSVKLTIEPSLTDNSTKTIFQMKNVKDSNYEIINVPENTTQGFNARKFTFTIEAEDVNGHKEVKTGDFQIFKVN
jgi:hypothetical protein